MKKGLDSAFFNPRALVAFVLCLAGIFLALVGSGAKLGSLSFGGTDINLITGTETSPHITQSTTSIWGHGNRVVVVYLDSRGTTLNPQSFCGVSASTDGGATFTRLPQKFNAGGACFAQSSVFYSVSAAKWYTSFLSQGCGGSGVGHYESLNGISWSNSGCVASSAGIELPTTWVDNNPASPFYGIQYAAFNDFNVGAGAVQTTRSTDHGATWSAPSSVFATTFRRAVKITGSPGADGTVFIQTMDEGGGHLNGMHQNFIHRSTDGGATWSTPLAQGAAFLGPGRAVCTPNTYFTCMYTTGATGGGSYWREMGWGQPAVGPNGVVHYAYVSRPSPTGDPGNILYIRSTDSGLTWSSPFKLNTDATTRAQWGASLSVNALGRVFVSWYDERNTANDSLERFGRASFDNGATWGTEMALSDVVFPKPLQPDTNVQAVYAGFYDHATFSNDGNGTTAYHAWTDGRVLINAASQQDVFFDKISLAGCTTFSQNFDGVTAPALPAAWVATNASGPAPLWVTSTTTPDTSPNDAFVDDPAVLSDKRLDSPGIAIATPAAQVSFRNRYNLETNFDGGVLEVSSPNINGGAFTDITNAAVGGSFVSGGYNATINGCCGNPIAGQMAWSGNSGSYINTVANLGSNVAGKTIKLRFRMASDSSASDLGWRIDTVVITEACPGPPVPTLAVSRKVHGGTPRDIPLPLAGNPGIECRTTGGTNDYQMRVTFGSPVTVNGNPQAQVISGAGQVGTGGVSNGGTVTINGSVVIAPLTNVTNVQTIRVKLSSVNDGVKTGDVIIPMGVLIGDTNGNRAVNSSDVSQTKSRSGQAVSNSNFRSDVNVNNAINASDISFVKSKSGTALP